MRRDLLIILENVHFWGYNVIFPVLAVFSWVWKSDVISFFCFMTLSIWFNIMKSNKRGYKED